MDFKTLSEKIPPIEALTPGTTGAADRYGDWISLKNAPNGVAVIVHMNQANATPATISLQQSTSVDGGGSPTDAKAISAEMPIYSNLDCAASDLLTKRTAAASYATGAGTKHKIVVIEVGPQDLDVANGFDCMRLKIATSNSNNIIGALYMPLGRRYPGDSMIAD